jgi:hypothetical protein
MKQFVVTGNAKVKVVPVHATKGHGRVELDIMSRIVILGAR